mgnify:CR=1 FL=1
MGEKKDSFRFTVQFNAGDPSHQQVAAILNEQGRRKAQFLVNAVTHYMNCPEPDCAYYAAWLLTCKETMVESKPALSDR